MAMQTGVDGKIDRTTTAPFLLRLFYNKGSHRRLDDFEQRTPLPLHLQIYTWPDCTIKELSLLLTSALPNLLPSPAQGTRLAFSMVYPSPRESGPGQGRYLARELGNVMVGPDKPANEDSEPQKGNMKSTLNILDGDTDRTLSDAKFVIGDYISCAIIQPSAYGEGMSVPPPRHIGQGHTHPQSREGYARPREGGYMRSQHMQNGGQGYGRGRGIGYGRLNDGGVPNGDWRRGERLPESRGETPREMRDMRDAGGYRPGYAGPPRGGPRQAPGRLAY